MPSKKPYIQIRTTNEIIKKFDYISLQPSRTGKSNDLISWMNKILCLRLVSFTAKQYGDFYKDLNDKAISNHIKQMQKLNIIKSGLKF